jgi:hypothetical protein
LNAWLQNRAPLALRKALTAVRHQYHKRDVFLSAFKNDDRTQLQMSRLDSFIRRLTAQRDILNAIVDLVQEIDGPVLEFGLGNGRTYDHLREHFPDRRIVAFDREVRSYSSSTPPAENMVTGEIRESGQAFIGIGAALAHADIGTGHDEIDAVTLTWLPQLMVGVLAKGGVAVSGLPIERPELEPLPLPSGIKEGRYYLYRRR